MLKAVHGGFKAINSLGSALSGPGIYLGREYLGRLLAQSV